MTLSDLELRCTACCINLQHDNISGCLVPIVYPGLVFFISVTLGFVDAILGILAAAVIFVAPVVFIVVLVIAFSSPKKYAVKLYRSGRDAHRKSPAVYAVDRVCSKRLVTPS